MTKLLNENNAKHIFSSENSGAHGFMSKGGVKYISAAGIEPADPNKSYISNMTISKGGTSWVSSITKAPEYLTKFCYDTKEISHGILNSKNKSSAQTMVKNAEKEITQNTVLKSRQAYTM